LKRLVIDALIYKKNKAYGYQEYLLNFLDSLFDNINLLIDFQIVILCDYREKVVFEKYSDRMIISTLNVSSKFKQLFLQNIIKKRLQLCNDDIILYTYNYSSFIKQSKNILIIHDLLFQRKKYISNLFFRLQRKIWLPISIKNSDKVIAISEFTMKDILKYYRVPAYKLGFIYNTFNFNKQTYHRKINNPRPFFLSVCSSAYHKNTETLLKAYESFFRQNNNFDLVLVGSLGVSGVAFDTYNDMSEEIKEHILILNGIQYDELIELYENCSLFISLSLFEGLGMPVVEALYNNRLVLLSNIEVFHEIAEDYAIYVNPLSISDIVEKMTMIACGQKYVNESSGMIKNKFSVMNTTIKYIELFNSL